MLNAERTGVIEGMIELIEQMSELGASTVVIGFFIVVLVLLGIKEIIAQVKAAFGWVSVQDIEKQKFEERLKKLEDQINKVDTRVTETSTFYDNKLEGFHKQSVEIRNALGEDLVSMHETQAEIKESLSDLKHMFIDNEIDTIRWEILDFASRVSSSTVESYSKEQFDHVFEIHEKYSKILAAAGLSNGRVDVSMKFLNHKYAELMEQGFWK